MVALGVFWLWGSHFGALRLFPFALFHNGTICPQTEVVRDPATGLSHCYGYVEFATPKEAQEAVDRFHLQDLDGKTIEVSLESDGGVSILLVIKVFIMM